MKLFLIRHGQTTTNHSSTYTGQLDVSLTEQGCHEAAQIQPILAQIPFDKVYSSDLGRAVKTQEIALPGKTAIQTPLLREFDVGAVAGKSYTFAPKNKDGITDFTLCGGESRDQVCDRIRKFLHLLEEDPCEYVAAFTHNGVMSSMMRIIMDADIDTRGIGSKNCAINVFEYTGARWRLIAWNYMGSVL